MTNKQEILKMLSDYQEHLRETQDWYHQDVSIIENIKSKINTLL